MAFLLNIKHRQKNRTRTNVVPTVRTTKTLGKPTASSNGGQVQQLLQRPTSQRSKPQQQQQLYQQVAAAQGVISLEEVMEDIRVLEQQQRDSQRKLQSAKLAKQHKLEQRSRLESKLASLKYSNGERKAQITRAREVLSTCTRELSSLNLHSDRSNINLKTFDQQMGKGRKAVRCLQANHRKIDLAITELAGKSQVLLRVKLQRQEQLQAALQVKQNAQVRESTLRQGIHNSKLKIKDLAEAVAMIRSDISVTEEELAQAQKSQAEAKHRLDRVVEEVALEDKRHEEFIQSTEKKVQECQALKVSIQSETKALENGIENKDKELLEAWECIVELQKSEGHEPSPEPTADEPLPMLDVDRLRKIVEDQDQALEAAKLARDKLHAEADKQSQELARLETEATTTKEEATAVRNEADSFKKFELDRSGVNKGVFEELEKERAAVESLRESVSNLETARSKEKAAMEQKLADQVEAIKAGQAELDEAKQSLEKDATNIALLKETLESEKRENEAALEKAKKKADAAKVKFDAARQIVDELKMAAEEQLQRKVDDYERAQIMMGEEAQSEIAQLLKEYPLLADLDVTYDPGQSLEEAASEVLSNLQSECRRRLKAAEKKRTTILNEIDQKRKKKQGEKRRLAAERERQEEAERESKERERQARKKAEREAREKKRLAQKKAQKDAKERQEREAQEQAEREAKEEREKQDNLELSAELSGGTVESSNRPKLSEEDGFPLTEADSSQEEALVGCLTQREGLHVPTPVSKDRDEVRPSQRVSFEGVDAQEVEGGLETDAEEPPPPKETSKASTSDALEPFKDSSRKVKKGVYGTSRKDRKKKSPKDKSSSSVSSGHSRIGRRSRKRKDTSSVSPKDGRKSASDKKRRDHSSLMEVPVQNLSSDDISSSLETKKSKGTSPKPTRDHDHVNKHEKSSSSSSSIKVGKSKSSSSSRSKGVTSKSSSSKPKHSSSTKPKQTSSSSKPKQSGSSTKSRQSGKKRSSREMDAESTQTSGISSMERVPSTSSKSRRRKKHSDASSASTSSNKRRFSGGVLARGVQDYDFKF